MRGAGARAPRRRACPPWPRAEDDAVAAGEDRGDPPHLVLGLAVHDGARARRVVADHAGDGRLVDGRRVGTELETERRGGGVERRLDDPGLDSRQPAVGIDGEDAVELEAVEDDARADRLAGQAGAGAARRERQAVTGRDGGRGDEIVDVGGHEHGLGDDAVPRGVGGVEPAARRAMVETRPATSRRSSAAAASPAAVGSGMRVAARHARQGYRLRAAGDEDRQPAGETLDDADGEQHAEDDEDVPDATWMAR